MAITFNANTLHKSIEVKTKGICLSPCQATSETREILARKNLHQLVDDCSEILSWIYFKRVQDMIHRSLTCNRAEFISVQNTDTAIRNV